MQYRIFSQYNLLWKVRSEAALNKGIENTIAACFLSKLLDVDRQLMLDWQTEKKINALNFSREVLGWKQMRCVFD